MTKPWWLAALLCLSLASCGWTQRRSAQQRLLGVDRQQALVAAHRVLTEQGFEVASVDQQTGQLSTGWRDRAQRSLRLSLSLGPGSTAGALASVELEVQAEARDRAVDGWTAAYPAVADARWLARRISRRVGDLPPAPRPPAPAPAVEPPAPRRPACETSRDCPPGQHCGSGHCVWECATDSECGLGSVCDRRGRCVELPPPQAPLVPAQELETTVEGE